MWDRVAEPWKIAFSQGWEAFRKGSIPIGAVVTDEIGNVISMGRNRMYESGALNRYEDADIYCHNDIYRRIIILSWAIGYISM